jgi:hypothetical protein
MAKMYISFLLNFFQPVTQIHRVLVQITDECYLPLAELFNSDLDPRFTLSVSHSLIQLLHDCGKDEVIVKLKNAVQTGHIEIMHSGAHHPIFPLISEAEVKRQIELDIQYKHAMLGDIPKRGIFSPELCYKDELVPLYKELGFQWTIIDDQLMEMYNIPRSDCYIYHIDGFYIFMRSSFWSDKITRREENWTGKKFLEHLNAEAKARDRDCYVIFAIAAETFGHHIKYYDETFLRQMLYAIQDYDSIQLCRISDLLDINTLERERIQESRVNHPGFDFFPPSSWATLPTDVQKGSDYPIVKSKSNRVHEKLWELTDLILDSTRDIPWENNRNRDLRELLDKAFYSCQYFWASLWYWNPGLIHMGIELQMRALYKCFRLTNNIHLLEGGERLYTELIWEIAQEISLRKKEKR